MPEADAFRKVRRSIVRLLSDGLAPLGFKQFRSTAYFFRDRGPIRDALFFQKMRSNSVTIAYGVSLTPESEEWSPGLKRSQWLADQASYNVKYEEHAVKSMAKALADFEREALPWFERYQTAGDI